MKKIFVAGPYNGGDTQIKEFRLNKITEYCTNLFLGGLTPVSPLLMGLNLAKFASLPTDTDTWKVFSQTLMRGCDELHVLMIEGFDVSKGVGYEIEAAKSMGIVIKYIEC